MIFSNLTRVEIKMFFNNSFAREFGYVGICMHGKCVCVRLHLILSLRVYFWVNEYYLYNKICLDLRYFLRLFKIYFYFLRLLLRKNVGFNNYV